MNERYVAKMSEVVKLCKETAALRRQLAELRRALEAIEDLAGLSLDNTAWEEIIAPLMQECGDDETNAFFLAIRNIACAALARVGGGGGEEETG